MTWSSAAAMVITCKLDAMNIIPIKLVLQTEKVYTILFIGLR